MIQQNLCHLLKRHNEIYFLNPADRFDRKILRYNQAHL